MLRKLGILALGVVLTTGANAVIVTLTFGSFAQGQGLGNGLFVTHSVGPTNTFAGDIIATGDSVGSGKYVCLTPTLLLNLPATKTYERTLVTVYSGIYAGGIFAATSDATNVSAAARQLSMWVAAGDSTANYSATNAGDALNYANAVLGVVNNNPSAIAFYLYKPVVQDANGNWVDDGTQVLAQEAVPEPFTMALGLAGLGVAIARRRRAH